MRTRIALVPLLGVVLTMTLTGCAGMTGMPWSGSPAPDRTALADFNPSDVHFNMMMIPHHEQAIEMSQTILAADGIQADVTDLATRISEAQAPEMQDLLAER